MYQICIIGTKIVRLIDVITEKFIRVKKCNEAVPIPDAIIILLSNEEARVKFAMAMTNNRNHAAKLLNMSERTYYRLNKYYGGKHIVVKQSAHGKLKITKASNQKALTEKKT